VPQCLPGNFQLVDDLEGAPGAASPDAGRLPGNFQLVDDLFETKDRLQP